MSFVVIYEPGVDSRTHSLNFLSVRSFSSDFSDLLFTIFSVRNLSSFSDNLSLRLGVVFVKLGRSHMEFSLSIGNLVLSCFKLSFEVMDLLLLESELTFLDLNGGCEFLGKTSIFSGFDVDLFGVSLLLGSLDWDSNGFLSRLGDLLLWFFHDNLLDLRSNSDDTLFDNRSSYLGDLFFRTAFFNIFDSTLLLGRCSTYNLTNWLWTAFCLSCDDFFVLGFRTLRINDLFLSGSSWLVLSLFVLLF